MLSIKVAETEIGAKELEKRKLTRCLILVIQVSSNSSTIALTIQLCTVDPTL